MKKKTLVTVIALVVTIGGYFARDIVNVSDKSVFNNGSTQISTSKSNTNNSGTSQPGSTDSNTNTSEESSSIQPNEIPALIKDAVPGGISAGKYIKAIVTKVTDGDTFSIKYKNEEYKVRMLDIDTPESVKAGVPVQEYSKEAYEFVKELILDKEVKLVFEKGVRDRYSRLLAHVVLEDGTYLNAQLVINGYARVELYSPNTKLRDYFNKLLQQAIDAKAGVWGLPKSRQPFIKDETGKYVPIYYEKAS